MDNLLDQPIFSAFIIGKPTPVSLTAVEALYQSEQIYDLADYPRQAIANVRFLASIIGLTGATTPAEAGDRAMKLNLPISTFSNVNKIKNKFFTEDNIEVNESSIATIFDTVASAAEVNFRSGVVKSCDNTTVICTRCIGRSLIRRTIFYSGGGTGNQSWPLPAKIVFATPLGNNLWETLKLCQIQGKTSRLWWSYRPKDITDNVVKVLQKEGELFGCSILPSLHSFAWREGVCYLCGNAGIVSRTVCRLKINSKMRDELAASFADPFVLCSQKILSKIGVREAILTMRTGDNFLEEANPDYGRIIELSLKQKSTSRFRYTFMSTDSYSKTIGDFGGVINLAEQEVLESQVEIPAPTWKGNTSNFISSMLKLTRSDLKTITDKGFCHPDSLAVIHNKCAKAGVNRLVRQLLIKLYATHPKTGSTMLTVTKPMTAPGQHSLFKELQEVRRRNLGVNWYQLARMISEKSCH